MFDSKYAQQRQLNEPTPLFAEEKVLSLFLFDSFTFIILGNVLWRAPRIQDEKSLGGRRESACERAKRRRRCVICERSGLSSERGQEQHAGVGQRYSTPS